MRRSLLTATGITALALAMPGAALAHNGHGHHHHHHHRGRAHAHHAKFRMVHIGSVTTTTPTTPTTPTPPAPANAGTVTSYTGGVLTLTLNDKSTVSGKVTNETRIRCVKATPPTMEPGAEGPGDDNGQGDDQSRGDMSQQQGDHSQGAWRHGDDGDDDDGPGPGAGEPEPPCDSSSLVAGAVVRAAELRIGPAGTEFESVLLVR